VEKGLSEAQVIIYNEDTGLCTHDSL
jgi:hypothetical protein